MASLEGSSGRASQLLPLKSETTPIIFNISKQLSRRQLTLIAIAGLLHVLLWSSISTLIASLYLVAADPGDSTNTPSEILTIVSVIASIAYILLHTIFSLKQRIWKHQQRDPAIVKKTSYIAVRVAVTLCILWLLTSGWNFIIFARRPGCLPADPSLAGWEAGPTCLVGRVGTVLSSIALIASFILFGMLAVVRRPFEAHILNYRYRQAIAHSSPSVSRRPSPTRSVSPRSVQSRGRVSASTHQSTLSTHSIADAETIDLESASPSSTIHAPSPVRPITLGIFQSSDRPPQIPAVYLQPKRTQSLETLPQVFYATKSSANLPFAPRMSTLIAPNGFVPPNHSIQYSASAWKAVHPILPMPTAPSSSTSRPVSLAPRWNLQLPYNGSTESLNFYRSCYSRSSVSLTRPNRLSSLSPSQPASSASWSDGSGSIGPEEGRSQSSENRNGSSMAGVADRMAANEEEMIQAYRILASAAKVRGHRTDHTRHASAPGTTGGASHLYSDSARKAKGWKPQLKGQKKVLQVNPSNLVPSSSTEFLGKASAESEASGDVRDSLSEVFEDALKARGVLKVDSKGQMVVRKTRSESPLRPLDVLEESEVGSARELARIVSRMPRDPTMKRRVAMDVLNNKPLPVIASL